MDNLRGADMRISLLSRFLRSEGVVANVVADDTVPEFATDSPQQVAVMTETGLVLSGSAVKRKEVDSFAASAGYRVYDLAPQRFFLYPSALEDGENRELFVLMYLGRETARLLTDHAAAEAKIRQTLVTADTLSANADAQARLLESLQQQASMVQTQIDAEQQETARLQAILADWLRKIEGAQTLTITIAPKYSPETDPSVSVLRRALILIDPSTIPCVPWDGNGGGVATPYLDGEMMTHLAEFFASEKDELAKLGAGGLALESAARTPVRGLALQANGNGLAVDPFATNHLIGVAVDFNDGGLFDYTKPGLSEQERSARQARYGSLAKLLAKHGITLGTIGKNGKPDPMHATLTSMARRGSAERRAKLLRIVSMYKERFAAVRDELAAKSDAATKLVGTVSASISTMDALVAAATEKEKQLEKQLADQQKTNAGLREQIESSRKTYDALREMRARQASSGGQREGFDARGLAERASRGEDVGDKVDKMFHETFERMAHEHEACRGEKTDGGFKIECVDRGTPESGGVRGGGLD